MKKFLKQNWFKIIILLLLLVTTIKTVESAHNSNIAMEKIDNLRFNVNLGSISGNVEDAMQYAERAADSCENIDTGSIEDAAGYAADAAQYAQEASQYAQKAAKNSSDTYSHCATPADLIIYCR